MNDSATSLDRLHDIVLPEPVPFWPPAPGWYAVMGLALIGLIAFLLWCGMRWRANAYRRAALRELPEATSVAQVSELLRRVALVWTARQTIAALNDTAWPDWLAAHCPVAMPHRVREQLAMGSYRERNMNGDLETLQQYARDWIARHVATLSDKQRRTNDD